MKKILFGLIATVMFGIVGNAQTFTKESVTKDLTNGTVSFYSSIKGYYQTGMNENDFYLALSDGEGFDNQTIQAKNVLKVAYTLLSQKASDEQVAEVLFKPFVIFTNQGLQLMFDGKAENLDTASSIMFGIKADISSTTLSPGGKGPSGDVVFNNAVGCRWYQIGCHIRWLFGTKDGRKTLTAIIEVMEVFILFF